MTLISAIISIIVCWLPPPALLLPMLLMPLNSELNSEAMLLLLEDELVFEALLF
ncbi:hypothetical protein [Thiothrix sp.]|uniref:hypothetical protein n=1 Tax=Thiothrix sp. TaxID=1032 RepID=UPI00257E0B44|nr:hypothetical protein [Thiothrix sp.]